jgi:hypothetical protein
VINRLDYIEKEIIGKYFSFEYIGTVDRSITYRESERFYSVDDIFYKFDNTTKYPEYKFYQIISIKTVTQLS